LDDSNDYTYSLLQKNTKKKQKTKNKKKQNAEVVNKNNLKIQQTK